MPVPVPCLGTWRWTFRWLSPAAGSRRCRSERIARDSRVITSVSPGRSRGQGPVESGAAGELAARAFIDVDLVAPGCREGVALAAGVLVAGGDAAVADPVAARHGVGGGVHAGTVKQGADIRSLLTQIPDAGFLTRDSCGNARRPSARRCCPVTIVI